MERSILTLNEILQKQKRFVIPNYQCDLDAAEWESIMNPIR